MTAQTPSWPAIDAPPMSVRATPADAGRSSSGPALTVLSSVAALVLVAFAILVLLPALIAAQAAAAL